MKRVISIVFVIILALSVAGCKPAAQGEIDIYVPDGAPALAVASIIADEQFYNGKVKVHVVTEDNIVPNILNGEADVALLPGDTAADLYNKGAEYKLLSANSFGLLYLVGVPMENLNELKGKVVYSIGKGKIPEYVFKIVLEANGLEYVESDTPVEGKVALKYMNGTEIVPSLVQGLASYALLGEPVVTQVLTKGQARGLQIIGDIQQLWKEHTGSETFVQSCALVSDEIAGTDFIDALVEKLQTNKQFLLDNTNQLTSLLQSAGSALQVNFTADIINRCNLDFTLASDVKKQYTDFLNILIEWDQSVVEGGLPDDGFYLR